MTALSHALLEMLKNDHGITAFATLSQNGHTINGQGMRLVQLNRQDLGNLSGVFVEIPVDISLETTDQQALDKVHVQKISDEDIEEAVSHIQRLARRGQIDSVSQAATSMATHTIETDNKGRRVLVRCRYS